MALYSSLNFGHILHIRHIKCLKFRLALQNKFNILGDKNKTLSIIVKTRLQYYLKEKIKDFTSLAQFLGVQKN